MSAPSTHADPDQVVLVDASGAVRGSTPRSSVHTADTPLHLAFSLYLFDAAGRVLVTRRALAKRTWPGVWTNACCGHPRPGEAMPDAIARRLDLELGLQLVDLECVLPDFSYRATDASGVVENEICPVFRARPAGSAPRPGGEIAPQPNPDEVMDWNWVAWESLTSAMRGTPFAFSPWATEQVDQLGAGANRW